MLTRSSLRTRTLVAVAVVLGAAAFLAPLPTADVRAQGSRLLDRVGVTNPTASIDLDEILSGGPPPQGIPALGFAGLRGVADAAPPPHFVSQQEASAWLGEREPVILMRLGGEARIYPLQILTWHEIANDTLGGVPVAVTFCPLCNSALAFDRRIPATSEHIDALRVDGHRVDASPLPDDLRERYEGQTGEAAPDLAIEVTYGVSGLLYLSNMLMFDDTTRTLWSQLVGEGLVGDMTGSHLIRYAAQIVSFAEASASEGDALVLSRQTGFTRSYGRNPYVGYDEVGSPAFLFRGDLDGRLTPKARVVSIDAVGVDGRESVAYPFDHLREVGVVNDTVAGIPTAVLWQAGTASALGSASIADARDVGAVGVFARSVDGRILTFEVDGEGFRDAETRSHWDITGRAVTGELAGTILDPVPHDNTLWFAWAAFRPETEIRTPGTGD
ncbi:MAG: DUF3179 domain-containing protein [Trueperaceae bacterium]|nr:DUF3179 domain-containing protein [Trueperaceae bacterium]